MVISVEASKELLRWKKNLTRCNGRPFISSSLEIITSLDALLKDWRASCQGHTAKGTWSMEKRKSHINVSWLNAAKLAIMLFTILEKDGISFHIRTGKMTVLSHLMKMGGTNNQEIFAASREIW